MTVRRLRQQFVSEGLEGRRRTASGYRAPVRKLDGKRETPWLTIVCSSTPWGRGRWTMTLLANRRVELNIVESINVETV